MASPWLSLCHTVESKDEYPSCLAERNGILEKLYHDGNIGRLVTVNIKFNDINPKTLLFNEIYPPTSTLSDCN